MIAPTTPDQTTANASHSDGAPPPRRTQPTVPTTPSEEATLARRAGAGDADAFAALVARYERPIYSFIYRMMGDADDADDLAQDVFVKAYRALPRVGRELNVSAWLHRIAANACLDVLRRRQRLRWLPWEGPKHDHLRPCGPADEPERAALGQEARVTVQRALGRMSHRHRLGLILREYEGLSCAEIGAVMGLSRSAVKSLLYRAREEFRVVHGAVEAERPPAGAARAGGRPAQHSRSGGRS